MKPLILSLILILSSCAVLDSIGTDTSRTDSQRVTVAIESMPYDQLSIECSQWPNAIACTTATGVYVQGRPKRTVIRLTVQYLNWADLGDRCGRFTGHGSCYSGGTLYTSSKYNDSYHIAGIGDLLDDNFNLNLDFNRRSDLGHEFYTHIMENGKDSKYGSSTPHIVGNF